MSIATFVTPPQRVELSSYCSILLKVQSSDEWRLVLFGIIHRMNLEELNTQTLASFYHLEKVFVLELETIKESNYWGPKKHSLSAKP